MPRYVILEHDHPSLHWDLMLEAGASLRTWRLEAPPTANTVARASASFSHRLMYLDYEGQVGWERGTVKRWDAGEYSGCPEDADCVAITVQGQRLAGIVTLRRLSAILWEMTYQPT